MFVKCLEKYSMHFIREEKKKEERKEGKRGREGVGKCRPLSYFTVFFTLHIGHKMQFCL